MSLDVTSFFWRSPRRDDWDAELKAAIAGADTTALRALAGERPAPMDGVKLARIAARLWPKRDELRGLRSLRIGFAGPTTASLLAAELPAAGLARGLLIQTVEAPFDTAQALAAGRVDLGGPVDALVLVPDEGAEAGDWLDLAARLKASLSSPVILATVVPPPAIASLEAGLDGSAARRIARVNAALAEAAARGEVLLWDMAGLAAEVGLSRWRDPARRLSARLPFDPAWAPLAADHLSRVLAAMAGRSARCLVLDLDNTLWAGVVGDDGVEGLRLGPGSPEGEAHLAVQQLALDLKARGVVLAVCSKNEAATARAPFERHPEMLLTLDDIAVFQADWSDKAQGLTAIAKALDLSTDALVVLDDNPAERAWVRHALPGVTVPELPDDPAGYPAALIASGAFEHLALNPDDLGRANAYQARAIARAEAASTGDYQAWLAGLGMRLTLSPFDAMGRPRIVQLIAKSNQFNLTARRYNEAQVAALEADPTVLTWQARLADRLGDHGMIGVVIVRGTDTQTWAIDSWLMSCRVLERGVEQALMNALIDTARQAGARALIGEWIDTGRNGLVAGFYDRMGFTPDGEGRWRLDLAGATPLETVLTVEG